MNHQFRQIFFVILLVEFKLDLCVVGVEANGALLPERLRFRIQRFWKLYFGATLFQKPAMELHGLNTYEEKYPTSAHIDV